MYQMYSIFIVILLLSCINAEKYQFIDQGTDFIAENQQYDQKLFYYADWSSTKKDMDVQAVADNLLNHNGGNDHGGNDHGGNDHGGNDHGNNTCAEIEVDSHMTEEDNINVQGLANCDPNQDCECRNSIEICDLLDNNGNGLIDENGVCKEYLANHCEFTLAWHNFRRINEWWTKSEINQESYHDSKSAYAKTSMDKKFHFLTLGGLVDSNDIFQVNFECVDPNNTSLINWINSHCHIYLGYENNYDFFNIDISICTQEETEYINEQKCIYSGSDLEDNGILNTLLIEATFNQNSGLAINFACKPHDQYENYHLLVQDSLVIFLGYHLTVSEERENPLLYYQPQDSFYDCLSVMGSENRYYMTNQDEYESAYGCLGTNRNQSWVGGKLMNHRVFIGNRDFYYHHDDQMVIGLFPNLKKFFIRP